MTLVKIYQASLVWNNFLSTVKSQILFLLFWGPLLRRKLLDIIYVFTILYDQDRGIDFCIKTWAEQQSPRDSWCYLSLIHLTNQFVIYQTQVWEVQPFITFRYMYWYILILFLYILLVLRYIFIDIWILALLLVALARLNCSMDHC